MHKLQLQRQPTLAAICKTLASDVVKWRQLMARVTITALKTLWICQISSVTSKVKKIFDVVLRWFWWFTNYNGSHIVAMPPATWLRLECAIADQVLAVAYSLWTYILSNFWTQFISSTAFDKNYCVLAGPIWLILAHTVKISISLSRTPCKMICVKLTSNLFLIML
jgi:hypothetical protein